MVLLVVLRSKKIYLAENTLDKTQIRRLFSKNMPMTMVLETLNSLWTMVTVVQTLTDPTG